MQANMSSELSGLPTPQESETNALALERMGSRERTSFLLLSIPSVAIVFVVLILPLAWLVWLSLFNESGGFTLDNYARMMRPVYLRTFITTFEISGIVTVSCVLLGYPVAYLLSQSPARLTQICMTAVLLPFWTSVLVRTYAWMVLLQREGLINHWLINAGIIDQPMQLVYNFFGTVVGMVHVMLPFFILPLYAAMKGIDPVLLSAASNCGATPTQAFRQVFLPLSLPGVLSGVVLVFVLCLGFYLTPALLGGGKVSMWSMQISDTISMYGNWGAASALGVALLVVAAAILWLLQRVFNVNALERMQ
nr:ABC transporter permease [uncultured Pseudogulbenkiania sp.]